MTCKGRFLLYATCPRGEFGLFAIPNAIYVHIHGYLPARHMFLIPLRLSSLLLPTI
jgi:hypothetical protein